jgi:hypothetical protein
MKTTAAQWRIHQRRWQELHHWEETLPAPVVPTDPTERLRWCEDAITLHKRFSPPSSPTLNEGQIQHWRLLRRCLPRRFPLGYGSA